ncbi:MAG: hypothetical protein IRZ03_08345 [Acidobacterium ailaaui]|nr:hypothetical protein [Pseudacidobacterium ailaaui]
MRYPMQGDRVVIVSGVHSGQTGTVIGLANLADLWVIKLDSWGAHEHFPRDSFQILDDGEEEGTEFDRFGLTAEQLALYVKAFSTLTANRIVEGQEFYDHGGYQEAEVVSLKDLLNSTLTDIEAAGTTLAILHLRVSRILGALKGLE